MNSMHEHQCNCGSIRCHDYDTIDLPGRYQFIDVDGHLREVNTTKDIPAQVSEFIAFVPSYPPSPHTPEQHDMIEQYTTIFLHFMKRTKGAKSCQQ